MLSKVNIRIPSGYGIREASIGVILRRVEWDLVYQPIKAPDMKDSDQLEFVESDGIVLANRQLVLIQSLGECTFFPHFQMSSSILTSAIFVETNNEVTYLYKHILFSKIS